MNIIRTTVNGLATLGAFGVATDKFALVAKIWSQKAKDAITKALEVPVYEINIGDSALVGILTAANSKGIVLPHIVAPRELETLQKVLGDNVNIAVVESKITCMGNCILVNDNGAIIHEKFEPEAIATIRDTLGVEVERGNILKSPLVGSHALATNRGVLTHPLTTEMEMNWLSERLAVPVNVGTINRGVPFVSIGCFANSNGAIAGKETTGPELQRLYQTLRGVI
ncbi:MAG: translation initiation factor IF-6 [Candidatus Heimdallarchaeota archaeon]|nr:MAG: translation initiation factor IF-6 [Candidatus Gerdarchaeota archaeon]RLI70152.1 MAG: translation initiation factor IF-6 [Candidatus Gerdarchaeota archaeon]